VSRRGQHGIASPPRLAMTGPSTSFEHTLFKSWAAIWKVVVRLRERVVQGRRATIF